MNSANVTDKKAVLSGLLELFRGLLADFLKQGGQAHFRRFFFSP